MEALLALQKFELQDTKPSVERETQIEVLRKKVPESVLRYFDHWTRRGKKPVAMVRGGVCCGCHLKIAIGVLADLATGDKIEYCGNCGRLLYLAQETTGKVERLAEALALPKPAKSAKPGRRRKEPLVLVI